MPVVSPARRLAAITVVLAVGVSLVAAVNGSGQEAPAPAAAPSPRTGGDLSSFQGMGTWIDIWDPSWSHPRASVQDMAARGVRTLYLETSNFRRSRPFVYREATGRFIDAAHDYGIRIVAWYLPGFVDVDQDLRRSMAAIRFVTTKGNGFDAFGLDIEAPEVRDPDLRSARMLDLSARIRAAVGDAYPLGAIIPSPRAMERNATYWPAFPYPQVAAIYDVFLPMTYYTWRVKGREGARWYTTKNITIIRREVGSDQVPIHVIGGIANSSSNAETLGFVRAVREHGIIGASFYTYPLTAGPEWKILRGIRPNPVQTPALPAPLGPTQMGNIPGSDTTHPNDVVYRTGGKVGSWDLSFRAFDPDAGEVQIRVNWALAGRIVRGPDGTWSAPRTLTIPGTLLRDAGPNTIVFSAADGSDVWGVRDVALTPTS